MSKNQALLSDRVATGKLLAQPVETDTDLFFMLHSENFFWPMGLAMMPNDAAWLIINLINNYQFREALINSELPQHMDVLPFSVADKRLRMKNKIRSH